VADACQQARNNGPKAWGRSSRISETADFGNRR
jgi:hypothetical protein